MTDIDFYGTKVEMHGRLIIGSYSRWGGKYPAPIIRHRWQSFYSDNKIEIFKPFWSKLVWRTIRKYWPRMCTVRRKRWNLAKSHPAHPWQSVASRKYRSGYWWHYHWTERDGAVGSSRRKPSGQSQCDCCQDRKRHRIERENNYPKSRRDCHENRWCPSEQIRCNRHNYWHHRWESGCIGEASEQSLDHWW